MSINYGASRIVLEIVSRTHFALLAEWWFLYIYYLISSFNGNTFNGFAELFKYSLFTKILFCYSVIAGVLILVLPSLTTVDNIDVNRIVYMPKKVLIISIFVIGLAFAVALYYIIRNKKNNSYDSDKAILYVAIISIIIYFIFQKCYLCF